MNKSSAVALHQEAIQKYNEGETNQEQHTRAHIHANRYTPQEVGGTLIGEDGLVVMAGTV